MARKTLEELEELKKQLGVNVLYSYSRLSTYQDDHYAYMLKYIKHIKEDRNDSIYANLGTIAHDLLDEILEGKITKEQALEKYDNKLLEYNLMGLKYNRTDEQKNNDTSIKYENNMKHFFINYQVPQTKCVLEPFVLTQCGFDNEKKPIYFTGYVDCIEKYEDEYKQTNIIITDFKTSSKYSGQDLIDHSKQLFIYAKAIHDKTNIPYERIHIQFHFLKYMTIEVAQVKGGFKPRCVERYVAIDKISSPIRTWLKKSKNNLSEEEIELLIQQAINDNNLDCLPEDVKDKFIFKDCYVQVPYTKETIDNLVMEIENTINEINAKTKQYYLCDNEEDKEKIFWQNVDDNYSFFMANLSGYSAKIHKPYAQYIENKGLFETSDVANTHTNNDNVSVNASVEVTDDDINQLLNNLGLDM